MDNAAHLRLMVSISTKENEQVHFRMGARTIDKGMVTPLYAERSN